MHLVLRIIKRLASLGIVLVAVGAVAAATTLIVVPQAATIVTANEGTAVDLELDVLAERSAMYAEDGTLLTYLSEEENREPLKLDEIPQPVVDAVLAIEDADFFEHDGVNLRATVRALVENVNAGGIAQGGSTITQQLVKLSLLNSDQNLGRKTTEAFYALRLERQMTKDEILERYLNTIYFGGGAYGVQAAAEVYWGYESAGQLGWAEAALLAGIIRSPYQFDPTLNPDSARERRGVVLDRLVATGHLSADEADQYKLAPLPDERQEPFATAPTDYFIQEALDQLLTKDPSILGGDQGFRFNALYRGGLQIYTTLDPKAQEAAVATRAEKLPDIKENCFTRQRQGKDPEGACIPDFTIAVATVDSHTGAVRALLGGPDFQREKFNLATQGGRQPGSSMKTYVLAALFENGYTPRDQVRTDRPCSFPNPLGEPDPYVVDKGRGGGGIGTITQATWQSNNCSFVRLGQIVGLDNVIDVAARLGLDTSAMDASVMSLPLGVFDVVPMQMASAYASFANDGIHNDPWYIDRIEDRDGNVIYEHQPEGTRAVSTQTARMIAEVLEGNVLSGTGRRAQIEDHHAAGKTGTTQDHYDAWFVGFTDYYTTAVWLGDPNGHEQRIEFPEWGQRGWSGSGRGGFGGEMPAEFWGAYMGIVHEDLETAPFAEPDPYGGGRYLRAPGELDFCDLFDFGAFARGTERIDRDGDGSNDCFRPIRPDDDNDGDDNNGDGDGNNGGDNGDGNNGGGGGGGGGGGPRPTLPPLPPDLTFTLPTAPGDD